MIRVLLGTSLVLGCGNSPPRPPEPWIDETLACVVRTTMEHAKASAHPVDVLVQALDVTNRPLDRVRARKLIDRIVIATDVDGVQVPRGPVLATAALSMAELGDLPAAAALAERAMEASPSADPGDRDYTIQRSVEVLAWSGAAQRARSIAGDRIVAIASAASGTARRGDKAGAQRLLAEIAASGSTLDPASTAIVAIAYAWSGDIGAAQQIITREPDPQRRMYLVAWVSDVLVRSKHPDRAAFVDRAIAEAKGRARTNDETLTLTVWADLVRLRDRVGGRPAARRELHEWLLGGAPGTLRNELLGINVVRAEVAGLPEEADRLLARLPAQAKLRASMDLAMARGEFARAFDLLDSHRREREQARAQTSGLPPEIVDAIDVVEVDLWLDFATVTRGQALVNRFRALVCP